MTFFKILVQERGKRVGFGEGYEQEKVLSLFLSQAVNKKIYAGKLLVQFHLQWDYDLSVFTTYLPMVHYLAHRDGV